MPGPSSAARSSPENSTRSSTMRSAVESNTCMSQRVPRTRTISAISLLVPQIAYPTSFCATAPSKAAVIMLPLTDTIFPVVVIRSFVHLGFRREAVEGLVSTGLGNVRTLERDPESDRIRRERASAERRRRRRQFAITSMQGVLYTGAGEAKETLFNGATVVA